MAVFQSKYNQLQGSSYDEVAPLARKEFYKVRRLTKRQPYVRSMYFNREKIFLTVFWDHLAQKHRKDQMHRLKFYLCALDLLRNTTFEPAAKQNTQHFKIVYYRFRGRSKDGAEFYVQVKCDARSGRKDFMSVFEK